MQDGHEGTGVVVATGNEVEDIKIGDHVGIQVVPTIIAENVFF